MITPNPHSFYAFDLAAARCVPDGEIPGRSGTAGDAHLRETEKDPRAGKRVEGILA